MRALPLIIFVLLLQIISPTTFRYTHVPSHSYMTLKPTQPLVMEPIISPPTNISLQSGSNPAPMGIADYGISSSGSFIRETTQWLGAININSLSATSNNSNFPNSVSFQLNVVLNYEYNGNTYALWVQDVALFNTQTDGIFIMNNIWNFSAPYANMTGVSGNGNIYTFHNSQENRNYTFYYYGDGSSSSVLSLPATIYLLVNVTTNSQGQPVIYFWYNDGNGWVNYDIVTVSNAVGASNVYFLVEYDNHPPIGSGYYYDAALIIGGPGDGTCAYINSGTVYFQLLYWNGHGFQEVRNAYSVGADTAEKVNNAIVQPYIDSSNGELEAELVVGTPSFENLWNQDNTTQLTVYTSVSNGYIYVYNENLLYSEGTELAYKVPFVGGEAILTLYPMDYAVLVYDPSGNLIGEANIYGIAGQSVSTNTTQFSISLNESEITLYSDKSGSVSITINAYGNVTISINSPSSVETSFTNEIKYVDGQKIIDLTLSPTQIGTYTITVNASIFPGYYVTQQLIVNVEELFLNATFQYNVVGQQLPQAPEINLTFPNGTKTTITIYNGETIKVPSGSIYAFQQVISQGNTRWITPTLVTGSISVGHTIVSATYYEQYLVNFEYEVTNGQWSLTSPDVIYYNFTTKTSVSLPAQVWVNYNSTYCYQNVTVGNERIIATNYEGTVTSPGTITVDYTLQYYVTLNSQIPVYAIVEGKNVTLTSDWYNAGFSIKIENITYYPSTNERYIITSISPSANVTVNSPVAIQINVQKQFYVTLLSPYPVYALINGENGTMKSGWYNANTSISIENVTNYPTKGIRFFILSVEPSMNISVNSPITITIKMTVQYYVTINSKIPVYAVINSVNETLKSGWYNANTTIYIENLTYYPAKDVRYLTLGVMPSQKVILTSPVTINITAVKQYYVTVNSQIPVYAIINGKNESLTSNWYNANTTIQVENIPYYPAQGIRYVIVSVKPSATINLTSPTTINITTVKQFYVNVNSQIPVKAIINGSATYLNSSWISEGTEIRIINYTYYTNGERYIITDISLQHFLVNSSVTVNVSTVKQFPVTVNGEEEWANQGEEITLTANVPFYDVGEFVGTYNVSPGTTITANSSITEKLILHPNYVFYGTVVGIVLIIAGVVAILVRRK